MEAEHLDGAIWLTKPKTAKGVRTVPIPQGLWDRLWTHIVKWGVPSHGLVFTNLYGHPHQTGQRGEALAPRPEDGGTAVRRHLQRTPLARHRTRLRRSQRRTATPPIMGHTDIHTTSVYTHWREQQLAETLAAALPDLRDGQ